MHTVPSALVIAAFASHMAHRGWRSSARAERHVTLAEIVLAARGEASPLCGCPPCAALVSELSKQAGDR